MTEDLGKLVNASYKARTRHDYTKQKELAAQALKVNPLSPPAAVLYFLADWDDGRRDQAANFMLEYTTKNGASGHLRLCLVLSMLHKGIESDLIIGHTYLWLHELSENDIRKKPAGNTNANVRLLKQEKLESISIASGQAILDRFGDLTRPAKSMSPGQLDRHWSLPSYNVVNNVSVLPGEWYLFDDHHCYFDEVLPWPEKFSELRIFLPPTSPSIIAMTKGRVVANLPNSMRIIDRQCILLGSNKNYYVWLVNHLARLRVIDGDFDFRELAILVDTDLPDTHRECLQHLGVRDENLIECSPDTLVFCKEIIVPTSLAAVDTLHPAGVEWLRDKFGSKNRDTSRPTRLFVSRSKPHRRRFKNEDEVFAQLEPLGFQKVTPDSLSATEQNALFENADIIIAPFGTCLTTSILAPETSVVFEIIDEISVPVHRFIENIAIQIGQTFEYVITSAVERNTNSNSSAEYEFEVDADSLIVQLQPHL